MANVINVAKCILEQLGFMTTMKLQKIVCYSQVGYLIKYKTALFDESIQAWSNGPVVPKLFYIHAGKFMIGSSDIEGDTEELTEPQKSVIIDVANLYKDCSGEQLRELTHSESPWVNARIGFNPGERCSKVITVDALLDYYGKPNSNSNNPVTNLYN